jgi:PEP-CTERM motif
MRALRLAGFLVAVVAVAGPSWAYAYADTGNARPDAAGAARTALHEGDRRNVTTVRAALARAESGHPRGVSPYSANRADERRRNGATQVLFVPSQPARPDTTAMLLAGVGLIGFVARRRQVGGRAP